MALKELIKVIAPPHNPVESGSDKPWPELGLGLPFPSDYMEFINLYGSGRIADFLLIFNPYSKSEDVNFFEQFELIRSDLEELNQSDPDYFHYPVFSGSEGLIPIGVTDNGDYILWEAKLGVDADQWRVAVIAARSPDIEYFQLSLTSLLAEILTGKINSDSFPDSLAKNENKFDKI